MSLCKSKPGFCLYAGGATTFKRAPRLGLLGSKLRTMLGTAHLKSLTQRPLPVILELL